MARAHSLLLLALSSCATVHRAHDLLTSRAVPVHRVQMASPEALAVLTKEGPWHFICSPAILSRLAPTLSVELVQGELELGKPEDFARGCLVAWFLPPDTSDEAPSLVEVRRGKGVRLQVGVGRWPRDYGGRRETEVQLYWVEANPLPDPVRLKVSGGQDKFDGIISVIRDQ